MRQVRPAWLTLPRLRLGNGIFLTVLPTSDVWFVCAVRLSKKHVGLKLTLGNDQTETIELNHPVLPKCTNRC